MWQRFTERARRVILLGQEEATQMDSGHVGSEHLLLGLVRASEGAGAAVLQKLGVSAEQVRAAVEAELPPSTASQSKDPSAALFNLSAALEVLGKHFQLSPEQIGQIEEQALRQLRKSSARSTEPKLTSKAKRVLELAAEEARRMHHNYIGTEHLLLALLREQNEPAAAVLHKLGLSLEDTRRRVVEYLKPSEPAPAASAPDRQYSAEQWQLIGEIIHAVQMAVDAMGSTGKGKKDTLEEVSRKLEQLKNRHQGNDADNSSEH